MATLSDVTTAALTAAGGPYSVVIASAGPTSGPYVTYHLVPSNVVSTGYRVHTRGGYSLDQLAASITAGTPIVVRPSAQQTSGPLGQPTYG